MTTARRPKLAVALAPVEGLPGATAEEMRRAEVRLDAAVRCLRMGRRLGDSGTRRQACVDANRELIGVIAHAAYYRLDVAALGQARTLLHYGDGPEAWTTGPLPAFLHTPSTREIDKAIRKIQSWRPKPAKHPAGRRTE